MSVPARTMLWRGLRRRCPVCNRGKLFRHWLRMVEACPRCGLHFQRVPGQWLGSWFLNICVAQGAVVLVLILGVAFTFPDTPVAPLVVAVSIVAVGVPLAFFPVSRTLWTAIDLVMRPLTFDEDVAPGFELLGDPDDEPPTGA